MAHYKCKTCGWKGKVKTRPRCLACARRRTAKWHKDNPKKSKAQAQRYDKKFRTERPDEYNAKRRRYRKPKTSHKQWQKRADWLRQGDVTRLQLVEIYERDKACVYCAEKVLPRFTPTDPRGFDHKVSQSNGGQHTATNIVVCCRKCNELKGNKDELFTRSMGN